LLKLPEPFIWAYEVIILYIIIKNLLKNNYSKLSDEKGFKLVSIFILWLLICFFRAINYANDYWTWKNILTNLCITSFYLIIFISTNINVIQKYFKLYFILFIPLVVLSYLIDKTPLNLSYVPYIILLFFIKSIPKKSKSILISIVIFFFFTNTQRNDLIKILFATFISLNINFIKPSTFLIISKYLRIIFLILPFFLVFLGSLGIFNIFKMNDYIKVDYTQQIKTTDGDETEDLKADTRTFIYENVFYTMNKYNAWFFGRNTAFTDEGLIGIASEKDSKTHLKGRYGNEVGILDILLWYGLIGVLLYFLIYVRASFLAIYHSNNLYAKAIGLYVSFLWAWSFVWEKPMFQTFFMMDLILLGLCFSNKFRGMNDLEVHLWVKEIFKSKSLNFNIL
jgi:hypothetical protein